MMRRRVKAERRRAGRGGGSLHAEEQVKERNEVEREEQERRGCEGEVEKSKKSIEVKAAMCILCSVW